MQSNTLFAGSFKSLSTIRICLCIELNKNWVLNLLKNVPVTQTEVKIKTRKLYNILPVWRRHAFKYLIVLVMLSMWLIIEPNVDFMLIEQP